MTFVTLKTKRKSKDGTQVNIRVLKEKLDLGVDVQHATVDHVNKAIANAFPQYYVARQRLTFGDDPKPLEKGQKLEKYGIKTGDTIFFKDLGPQIGWTTVFIIEYLGPILIHPLFYFFPQIFYPNTPSAPHTRIQTITFILTILHFLKREYETIFVHRFSNDTMPLRNLPKNCAHYWLLSGLAMAYPIYAPGYNGGYFGGATSNLAVKALVALWVWAEVSNYLTHVNLRNLRPPGTRERKIPFGYGFNWVSCPNYFFECVAWLAIALLTGSFSAYGFFLVGFGQMYLWAVKKHLRYKKDFGSKWESKHERSTSAFKYLVAADDYKRLPRWENDGISTYASTYPPDSPPKPVAADDTSHFATIQREITQFMGVWPYNNNFKDMSDDLGRSMVLHMPFIAQKSKAEQQQDLTAAIDHSLVLGRSRGLLEILKRAGLDKAIKDQKYRFPGLMIVLTRFAQNNLATDENLDLLFGSVRNVRGIMLEVGSMVARPPPEGSPADNLMQSFATEGQRLKLDQNQCKNVGYCSPECQKTAWPLHKPGCLRACGKPVPASVQSRADKIRARKDQKWEKEWDAEQAKIQAQVFKMVEQFRREDVGKSSRKAYSYDCMHVRRAIDLPVGGVEVEKEIAAELGLEFKETVNLLFIPKGIPDDVNRGVWLVNPATKAFILVMHTRLFADMGDGNLEGHALDGIYVVEKVIQEGSKAKAVWKKLQAPQCGQSGEPLWET